MSFLRPRLGRVPVHALVRAGIVAAILTLMLAATTQAHVVKSFGSYSIALGWVREPTYVGQLNAVQAFVTDSKGKPVTDLAAGDLKVVVTAGGQDSSPFDLAPTYDEDTGLGTPGDYEAPLVPTIPGDYTFHLTGSIHGTAVDETATSSESTFESAVDSTSVDFPTKLPSLSDIATRLDRIDARASAAPAASATTDAATKAQDTASTALIVGGVAGALGIVIGVVALVMATRARRPSGS